jgi:hypothetical protein
MDNGRGLLNRVEKLISAGDEGTPLRPFITSARKSAESLYTTTNSSVRAVADTVETEIDGRIDQLSPITSEIDQVYGGARIRPDLKFGVAVGLTAIVSSRFGGRALVRNTIVVSILSTFAFFPDSLAKGMNKLRKNFDDSKE